MIITGREAVSRVYQRAREQEWVLPCFNSENLTTTEAILAAARAYGNEKGIARIPVIIGITLQYEDRPQSVYYTHSRQWEIGLRLFLDDLRVLAGEGGPYEDVDVIIHLDHVIHRLDAGLLDWDLSQFSSIMYDASSLSMDENIAATARFVERYGHLVLVEGACDEIDAAGDGQSSELTSPDKAERYLRETGVDFIVANLGTEHRASVSELRYSGERAQEIRDRIGPRLVLHGGSSVQTEAMGQLAGDGICKVNVWTLLERESGANLLVHLVENAGKVAGAQTVKQLRTKGLLGEGVSEDHASLNYFSTTARQAFVFEEMKVIIHRYLSLWYR